MSTLNRFFALTGSAEYQSLYHIFIEGDAVFVEKLRLKGESGTPAGRSKQIGLLVIGDILYGIRPEQLPDPGPLHDEYLGQYKQHVHTSAIIALFQDEATAGRAFDMVHNDNHPGVAKAYLSATFETLRAIGPDHMHIRFAMNHERWPEVFHPMLQELGVLKASEG